MTFGQPQPITITPKEIDEHRALCPICRALPPGMLAPHGQLITRDEAGRARGEDRPVQFGVNMQKGASTMSWEPRQGEDEVLLAVRVYAVTFKAILVELLDDPVWKNDKREKHWIPLSQIADYGEINHRAREGDEGNLILSPWIAKQKGLL